MLRSLFSLLLLALFISKLLYSLIWQVHYELNKAEITARYCENKNRPELHCNGQCYLAKQLKKADLELQAKEQEQQQHLDFGSKIFNNDYFISIETNTSCHLILTQRKKEKIPNIAACYSFDFSKQLFHPPCIV